MSNKGADQTARMRRLVCAFVVRKPLRQIFSRRGPRRDKTSFWGCRQSETQTSLLNNRDYLEIENSRGASLYVYITFQCAFQVVRKPTCGPTHENWHLSHVCKMLRINVHADIFSGFRGLIVRLSLHLHPCESGESAHMRRLYGQ